MDFLSLDVQGAEELVLSTIPDLARFKIVLVELADHPPSVVSRIRSWMSAAGLIDVTFRRGDPRLVNPHTWIRMRDSSVFMPAAPRSTSVSNASKLGNYIEPIPTPGLFVYPSLRIPSLRNLREGFEHTRTRIAELFAAAATTATEP